MNEYLERELKRGVGLEEAGVKLFREADGLADLAGEHEPLNVLPVADDIEQRLCRFLVEEGTLGSRTVLQSGVPDDFTDRDA